jgi:hypothetical protein
MKNNRNTHVVGTWLAAVWVLSVILGCGKPQTAPENRGLISSLRTAVNTQNAEWLEKNAKLVEERYSADEMTDAEHEEFQAIIAKARDGKWEEAERETIVFQKAQRPTREEIERVSEYGQ